MKDLALLLECIMDYSLEYVIYAVTAKAIWRRNICSTFEPKDTSNCFFFFFFIRSAVVKMCKGTGSMKNYVVCFDNLIRKIQVWGSLMKK